MKSRLAWTVGNQAWWNSDLSYKSCMTDFTRGQDGLNPATWLATGAGYNYQPIGILPSQDFLLWPSKKKSSLFHKINIVLTNLSSGFIDLKLNRIFQHSKLIINLLQLLWQRSCMRATWNWGNARARGEERKPPLIAKNNKPYASSDFLLQLLL